MINRSIEQYTAKINISGQGNDRQAIYKYVLLECEKEIEYYDRIVKLPCFGIEIIREDIYEDGTHSVEHDSIECMTTYRYKAVQLLKKLYDNCVSPVHLIDIAGNFADEWACDFDNELSAIAVQ